MTRTVSGTALAQTEIGGNSRRNFTGNMIFTDNARGVSVFHFIYE